MIDVFKEVKRLVTIQAVAEDYGLKINRAKFVKCPFHGEKTASMKLYESYFVCFGCGEKGDVITLTARLYGLTPIEAVRWLNSRFCLNLPIDGGEIDREEIRKRERKKWLDEEFRRWEKSRFLAVSSYFRLLRKWRMELKPLNMEQAFCIDERFAESLSNLTRVEALLEVFIHGNLKEKQQLYIVNRKEVNAIYERMEQRKRDEFYQSSRAS